MILVTVDWWWLDWGGAEMLGSDLVLRSWWRRRLELGRQLIVGRSYRAMVATRRSWEVVMVGVWDCVIEMGCQ